MTAKIQHLHSRSAGHTVNMAPGQIAVNLADAFLWLRAAGRRVVLDMQAWTTRAIPAQAPEGSVLTKTADGVAFNAQLAPSSVVGGRIDVDQPTVGSFAVLGLRGVASADPISLDVNDVLVEPLYIASTNVSVTQIAFNAASDPAGAVRLVICSPDGLTIAVDALISSPTLGGNVVTLDDPVPLATGAWLALLWSAATLSVGSILGYHTQQGWSFDEGSGLPVFVNASKGSADLSAGAALPSFAPDLTGQVGGEFHAVLMGWTLGS